MKFLILVFIGVLSGSIYGQSDDAFFLALKNKDINQIKEQLSSDVDLCIVDYQDYLSRSDAMVKIADFLKKENPRAYEIIHIGKSNKTGSNYNVAKLYCNSGNYRVFVYYKKSGTQKKISEIRFDK